MSRAKASAQLHASDWTASRLPWLATPRILSQLVPINLNACNPYADKDPTAQYLIRAPPSTTRSSANPDSMRYVYSPEGKLLGAVATQTAKQLCTRYAAMQRERPDLHAQFQAGIFPEELAKLLLKYKPPSKSTKSGNVLQNQSLYQASSCMRYTKD